MQIFNSFPPLSVPSFSVNLFIKFFKITKNILERWGLGDCYFLIIIDITLIIQYCLFLLWFIKMCGIFVIQESWCVEYWWSMSCATNIIVAMNCVLVESSLIVSLRGIRKKDFIIQKPVRLKFIPRILNEVFELDHS